MVRPRSAGRRDAPHTPHLRHSQEEWDACAAQPAYFLRTYAQIENPAAGGWTPFDLWPAQEQALAVLLQGRRVAVLKARQLGLTWLCLGYALWRMTFHPAATVLLFSQTERSARELIVRLRGMHARLPEWLQRTPVVDRAAEYALDNGSRALAFSTRGGRSYAATLALVDEADFIPDLAAFLNAVKPTVDSVDTGDTGDAAGRAGGQFFLVSTADKRRPLSPFKQIFRAARPAPLPAGERADGYAALFLPWHAHPGRTPAWYARVRGEMYAQRGSDDDLHQEYPATPEEALALPVFDRRLPPEFLAAAYAPASPLPARFLPAQGDYAVPALPGLAVFRPPQPGGSYVIGCDPAEGNPQSDESVAALLDAFTGEQIAVLGGRLQPESFAAAVAALSAWAGGAPALVERNNHGHTVIAWLREHSTLQLLPGLDRRPGWLTNAVTKTRLYDETARACRTGECLIHDAETHAQLASLEASTLAAPSGGHDDRATACALALAALRWAAVGARGGEAVAPVVAPDPLDAYDRGAFV